MEREAEKIIYIDWKEGWRGSCVDRKNAKRALKPCQQLYVKASILQVMHFYEIPFGLYFGI